MTTTPTDPLQPFYPDSPTAPEHLRRLWAAFLKYVLETLESGEPVKASFLNVVRAFLVDQGINARTMSQARLAETTRALITEPAKADNGIAWRLPTFVEADDDA